MKALPEILLQDLEQVPGFDRAHFLQAHQQPAVTSVRLNPQKPVDVFKNSLQVPWCSTGRYLQERPVFTLDPLFHAGAYYVQEASSMFLGYMIEQLVPERNNLRVLDLCAAPGGKSTLLASMLGDDSLLLSNEVIRTRASVLEENLTRWGQMNTWVCSNDPRDLGKLKGYFDVIVVDAPCSGSGLFRKDERALDEWSENNVQLCAQRQQRILSDIWPALKQNGILIYATCSYSPQEDEEILDWLGDNFSPQGLSVHVPAEWGVVTVSSEKNSYEGYRFMPHKVRGEGFFIAAVRKHEEAEYLKQPKFKSLHDKKVSEQCSYLLDVQNWSCISHGEEYVAINANHDGDIQQLQQHVYLRKIGTTLGVAAKNSWLPAHDIALSVHRSKHLPLLELNKEQALKFLKKEDVAHRDVEKGWYVASYEGQGLGWIKALGNRSNNYLPKHWRIRMDIEDKDWA